MGLDLGANTFPFDTPGDHVEGVILSVTQMQATDMESGEPLFWDASQTRPKMLPVIELQTDLSDGPQDDGRRTVHLSGGRYSAVKKATSRIDEGAWLKLTFTELSDREPPKKGYNRAKLFRAEYRPAVGGVDLNGPATATPAAQQQYAQPAQVMPQPAAMQLNAAQLEMLAKLGGLQQGQTPPF